jgi:dimethylargininase
VKHYAGDDEKEDGSVSLSVCQSQHASYVQSIQQAIPTLTLPAAHNLPDSVFVEDTALVIRHEIEDDKDDSETSITSSGGPRAILLQPGHPHRQAEVAHVRDILKRLLPAKEIYEMADLDSRARCDGGDVLYTGRHLFVGVSERTNEEALAVLEKVYPNVPLVPVELPPQAPVLHLKSAVTHMDERTLVAPTAPWASSLLRDMRAKALGYDVIRIPDVLACNLVRLPDRVLLQDTPCSESRQLLAQAANDRKLPYHWVNTSELAKKDAALTCCSILISF